MSVSGKGISDLDNNQTSASATAMDPIIVVDDLPLTDDLFVPLLAGRRVASAEGRWAAIALGLDFVDAVAAVGADVFGEFDKGEDIVLCPHVSQV